MQLSNRNLHTHLQNNHPYYRQCSFLNTFQQEISTEFRRMFPGNRWQATPKPVDLVGESGVEIERVVREDRRFCSVLFCRRCLLLYITLLLYCTKLKEESLRIFPTTGGKPRRSQADPQQYIIYIIYIEGWRIGVPKSRIFCWVLSFLIGKLTILPFLIGQMDVLRLL